MKINDIFLKVKNIPNINKVYYVLIILLIIIIYNNFMLTYFNNIVNNNIETFENKNKNITIKKNNQIYDDVYVNIYDDILFSDITNYNEIGNIINNINPISNSIILEIGCKTGYNVNVLNKKCKTFGLEESVSFINKARQNFPKLKFNFQVGDPLIALNYLPNSFTHILCLNNTIYKIKNKDLFFENTIYWLKPGGYLIITLFDRTQLNKQVMNFSKLKDNFNYKNYYQIFPNDDTAVMKEIITYNDNIIQNEEDLHIPTQRKILNIAKECGFLLISSLKDQNKNVYILKKPI